MSSPKVNYSTFHNERVQNTARGLGYVVVTQRTKKSEKGFVNKAYLMCDRGGVYKASSESTTHSGTKKIGCPFKLIAKHHKNDGGWKLEVKCDRHNHEPSKFLEGHAYVKRLSKKEFVMVEDMTMIGIQPRHILTSIKENNMQNVSTIETIYDAQKKIRMAQKVGRTPMQTLLKSLHTGGYVYHIRTCNYSNKVQDLFFMNPTSVDIWRAFPHVLLLDATYKTNRYRLPFLEIVGLTSTNKTFCIAFAVIENEKTDNFKWALNCLRQTLDRHMLPRVIVTDRELALMEACRYVFPEATRLLCRFHISENIKRKCRLSFPTLVEWEKFIYRWNYLVASPTIEAYEQNRIRLQSKLIEKHQNVFNYLDGTWLQKYKEMFVSAWIDKHLNFGERTTNRVESQHALLKRHLKSHNSAIDKFIRIINNIVHIQYTQIKASFGKNLNKKKHQHHNKTFALLLNKVSIEALDILTRELRRAEDIKQNGKACGCRIRTSCGLPCACEIALYVDTVESIPLHSIDIFWKKLDFSPALLNQEEPYIAFAEQLEKFKEAYDKETNPLVKRSWLQKLNGIYDPSNTGYDEPIVQTKARGRPTMKSKQQKKEPPRHGSFVKSQEHDYTPEPPMDSSSALGYDFIQLNQDTDGQSSFAPFYDFMGLNEHTVGQTYFATPSVTVVHEYIDNIPEIFRPYVTRIHNVLGDGNCGFRATASALGYGEEQWLFIRRQLMEELLEFRNKYPRTFCGSFKTIFTTLGWEGSGFAPKKHWMIMPDTGFLIANKFNVIVHFVSEQSRNSSTCFPLWRGPDEFPQKKIITIAHVNTNHFIMVELQEDHPMASTNNLWTLMRESGAADWENVFKAR